MDTIGEIANATGKLGFRSHSLVSHHGDRVLMGGVMYAVVGQPQWEHEHPWTGSNLGYAWVQVTATTN
jgi:hypothetical protein